MKKLLVTVMIVLMSFSLSACQKAESPPEQAAPATSNSVSSEPADNQVAKETPEEPAASAASTAVSVPSEKTESSTTNTPVKKADTNQPNKTESSNLQYDPALDDLLDEYQANTQYRQNITNDRNPDTFYYDSAQGTLKINNSVIKLEIEPELVTSTFKIVDVNIDDNYKEFVFDVACPPSDNELWFYWYDGTSIYWSGTVSGSYATLYQENLYDQNNGQVASKVASNLIQDAYYYEISTFNRAHELIWTGFFDTGLYLSPVTSRLDVRMNFYKQPNLDAEYFEMNVGDEFTIIGEKDGWLSVKSLGFDLYINGDDLDHTFNPQFAEVKFWS